MATRCDVWWDRQTGTRDLNCGGTVRLRFPRLRDLKQTLPGMKRRAHQGQENSNVVQSHQSSYGICHHSQASLTSRCVPIMVDYQSHGDADADAFHSFRHCMLDPLLILKTPEILQMVKTSSSPANSTTARRSSPATDHSTSASKQTFLDYQFQIGRAHV